MPVVGNEVAADVDGVVADVVGTKLGEADEFEHPVHAGSVTAITIPPHPD